MNVKLHTPKTLQMGSGMSSLKQFLLSLIATSVSIILTFGTAAIIDYNKKQAAKKEMVMMIISDMDNTIELCMSAGVCRMRSPFIPSSLIVCAFISPRGWHFFLTNFLKRPRESLHQALRPSTPSVMSISSMRFPPSI